jgi:multidrug efflux system membrane fusion protein
MEHKAFQVNSLLHSLQDSRLKHLKVTAVVLALFLVFSACGKAGDEKQGKKKSGDKPPAPVTVIQASEKTVPVTISGTGHVEAGLSVEVKPRVGGKLVSVHFREGGGVKKGDVLFSIDSVPFKAKLAQARADLEKDKARLVLAKRQVKRYSTLSDKGYLSTEEYEQLQNDAAVLEATVQADRAAVETAELDLSYCSVRAEIDGVTGEIAVDAGNLVTAGGSTPLTTIRQIAKLDVSFTVPEQHFREIRSAMGQGPVRVSAVPDGEPGPFASGVLTFIDNTIDRNTGTVALKARFENGEKSLWPGQFVRVTVDLPIEARGVAVPSQSVQTGQKGSYVYVITKDGKAEARTVTAGRSVNGDTLIEKGLALGETVVVEGHLKLSPGAKVAVVTPGGKEPKDEPKKEKAEQP